jgi:hypothetical protein
VQVITPWQMHISRLPPNTASEHAMKKVERPEGYETPKLFGVGQT